MKNGKETKNENPGLVLSIPWLKGFLVALVKLTEDGVTPKCQIRAKRYEVDYIKIDASGLGSGSVL